MDEVFKALADPTRRELLDALFAQDGQSLRQLEGRAEMSRFGVMKHLAVLEDAHLVLIRRQGREKLHFLNPVPIRVIYERWVSKYADPVVSGLLQLKAQIEGESMRQINQLVSWAHGTAPVSGGTAVFEVFIKTTPERLWEAITAPRERALYSFGVEVESEWTEGSGYRSAVPGGPEIVRGVNLVVEPPRLLVQTYQGMWNDEVRAEGDSRVTWEIEPVGSSCRLTVIHDQLAPRASSQLYGGWPMLLSGLKTLLETGQTLDTPGSLRYAATGF